MLGKIIRTTVCVTTLLSVPLLASEEVSFAKEGSSLSESFFKEMLRGEFGPGNGGDVVCEKQIINIRDDIESWILRDDHLSLELNFKNSSRLKDISHEYYKKTMLESIEKAPVICTNELRSFKTCINVKEFHGFSRYVSADMAEKILNGPNDDSGWIICNPDSFKKMTEEEQYELTHHEYAGLAGLETNNGKIKSDYSISNQISGFLEDHIVKKLAIGKSSEKNISKSMKKFIYNSRSYCKINITERPICNSDSFNCALLYFSTPNAIDVNFTVDGKIVYKNDLFLNESEKAKLSTFLINDIGVTFRSFYGHETNEPIQARDEIIEVAKDFDCFNESLD